jgi:hypothetical protein
MCTVNRFVQPWKPWWGQSSISNTIGSSSSSDGKSLIHEISNTSATEITTNSADAQQQQQVVTVQHSTDEPDEQTEATAVDDDNVIDDDVICEKHTPQALMTAATAVIAAATSSSISSSVTAASALIKHVVLDVLCAYAYTLRLYNGCWCCDPIQVRATNIALYSYYQYLKPDWLVCHTLICLRY